MRTYIFFFLTSLFFSMVLTPVVRLIALRFGFVDKGGARKVHKSPIPRIGGVAIFFAALIPFTGFLFYQNMLRDALMNNMVEVFAIIMGGIIIFLMGVFDDVKGARARYKFLVEILAACLVYYGGVRIDILSNPFGAEPFHFGVWIGLPLTVFWITGVTNAVNLSDGIDGLAAGLSTFIGITIFVVALVNGHALIALFAITLVGSTVGFLVFNFPPAKIFMGDSGALFLGYMLASISILGSMKSTTAVALVIPILAMIVPIADTLMAIIRRTISGKGIAVADKNHFHHRLLKKGFSTRQVIITLYLVTIFFGLVALTTLYMNGREVATTLALVGVLLIVLIRRLGYKELEVKNLTETIKEGQEERKKTHNERAIIRRFEADAKELDSNVDIWTHVIDTLKKLGYKAIEITPEKGTSLFRKQTNIKQSDNGTSSSSPPSDKQSDIANSETESLSESNESNGRSDTETIDDGLSFYWRNDNIEVDPIKMEWYLKLPVGQGKTQFAKIKVYKPDQGEAQKIHDEVILELLCEAVYEALGEGTLAT